jgi:D-alanyl-D-alanine carboxypeptidase/D-alanyl-D-alanine-endopeptidase (penicillin-binding protein 4)
MQQNIAIKKLIFLFFYLLIGLDIYSQNNEQPTSIQKLNNEIEKLKIDKILIHASWSVCVMSVKTGEIISEYKSEQSLIPASTMKIVTTGAALSILGKDYQFKTTLEYDGYIDSKGILHGNIYIKGGGDPSFGSVRFDSITKIKNIYNKWIQAIKKKGISKIEGSVVADAEIFDWNLIPLTWIWKDIGNYYGTGTCGLSVNENLYKLIFKPGNKIGYKAKVLRTEPEIPDINFINNVKTARAGSGDNVIIYGSPYSNTRFLEGTVPLRKKEFTVKGSMPDPAYFCAYSFSKYITEKGITINRPATTVRMIRLKGTYKKSQKNKISTYLSPALEDIIKMTNIKSINSYAETLLKFIGWFKLNDGSTESGIKAVKQFWLSKNVDLSGFLMKDGSGLSPVNRITTRQLSEMLCAITKDKIYEPFFNSLPVAGKSGSIKKLFKATAAENNLRAKSGYLSGVRAYSGYVNNKKNEQIVFSVIVNNYKGSPFLMKKKLEKLMILIAETE